MDKINSKRDSMLEIDEFYKKASDEYGVEFFYEYSTGDSIDGRRELVVYAHIPNRAIERKYTFPLSKSDFLYSKPVISEDNDLITRWLKRLIGDEIKELHPKPEKVIACMQHSLKDINGFMKRYFLSREESLCRDMSLLGLKITKSFKDNGNSIDLTIYVEGRRGKKDFWKFILRKEHLRNDYLLVHHCMIEAADEFISLYMSNTPSKKEEEKHSNMPSMGPSRATERNEKIGNERGKMDKDLEMRMIREECEETCQAIESDDKKEVIDGCIDLIFVLFGTLHKTGLSPKHIVDAYNAVCDSNNSKTGERFANGKIKKGKKFVKPDFSNILKEIGASTK